MISIAKSLHSKMVMVLQNLFPKFLGGFKKTVYVKKIKKYLQILVLKYL